MTAYIGTRVPGFLARVEPRPYQPAYNWWWPWWVWVGGFIILMLIIFLIAYGVRGRDRYTDVPPADTTIRRPPPTPLEILRARY